ncbi:unnamed protein product [Cuscuta campestris]|uniref:RRM domain-containing protein n=1 Tax=Cuscuta campestris TaxID=132261 RepID=A0A484KL34_9ASTE|nr:unnamed protein product [Cuscuta campestris]
MDYGVAGNNDVSFYGGGGRLEEDDLRYDEENGGEIYSRSGGAAVEPPVHSVDGSSAVIELQNSVDESSLSAGKLFVGGIAWETSQECFNRYFSKYGEVLDSIIMMDKISGRPRGFGFVTYADPEVADRVLQEVHVIDGREVDVKRTVPREETAFRRSSKTKKIFVGGLPPTLCDDDLREYFSTYGNVVEQQIMLDHTTGRSRGFGFVSFDSEDSVEKVLSDGRMHELNGKQVEIKRAEPKRGGGSDHMTESRTHHFNNNSTSYGKVNGGTDDFSNAYGMKMHKGYGGYGSGYGSYGPYGNYVGNFGMNPMGFYGGGYGSYGYGYGFGGPYGAAGGFGGNYGFAGGYGYGAAGAGGKGYGNMGSHGGAKGFAATGGGESEYDGVEVHTGGNDSGYGGGGAAKGYGGGGGGKGNDGAGSGRFHPYRK